MEYASDADEVSLADIVRAVRAHRLLIGIIVFLFVAAATVYLLLATPWYRAELVMVGTDDQSSPALNGTLGGLASLAGVEVGKPDNAEPLAVLQSQDFTRAFIEDEKLLTVLLADRWDAESGRWRETDPADQPDIRDAVEYFDRSVRRVEEDFNSKIVTLTIEWEDPELAADWANKLVTRLNDTMRRRALAEATANVKYLEAELAKTPIVTLQQAIGGLLESEMQKLMMARGHAEFSFRVIDRADPAKYPYSPRPAITLLLALIVGIVVALVVVAILRASRGRGVS